VVHKPTSWSSTQAAGNVLHGSASTWRDLSGCDRSCSTVRCVAGKGTFTAAMEVQGQKQLVVSFLHHQAVQRLSHNPLEQQDVVGVTNYLDVGLQVSLQT